MADEKQDYGKTLNLPSTEFPMRGNLPENEPKTEQEVFENDLYEKIDLNNLYDMPHLGSITQKDEPLLTIIDKDKDFDKLYEKVESSSQTVNKLVNNSQ